VVSVSVTLDAPREAELHLSYQVNGPGWAPTYRALLDTHSNALRLERQAQVAQTTGEDWLAVPLRLSTGQPRRSTSGPQPDPWRIGRVEVVVTGSRAGAVASPSPLAFARYRDSGRDKIVDMVTEDEAGRLPDRSISEVLKRVASMSFDASVFDNSFATEFVVPQRVDIPSGGPSVTLALGVQDATVTLFTRSTPHSEASAWLVAELPQPEGVWPVGALQLYRDGAYVGSDRLRTGGKGPLALSFGRDDLVRVQVEPQKDMRGSTGFVGSRTELTVQRAYTVENRHKTPITLQVLEASPVVIDENVTVENKFDPKPESMAWNDQPGVVLWSTHLDAGKTARFTTSYVISYPKDARFDAGQ
jgi:uncharacterized protein (TIGR02231 family)